MTVAKRAAILKVVILGYTVSDEPITAREKLYPSVWLKLTVVITSALLPVVCFGLLSINLLLNFLSIPIMMSHDVIKKVLFHSKFGQFETPRPHPTFQSD